MKTKILTGLAALSLLVGVVSTQGCYDGGGWGGGGYGGGYSTYAAGPSYYGPAFVGHPYAYGYRGFGHDGFDRSGFAHDGHEFAGGHDVFHGGADTSTVDTQWRIRHTEAIRTIAADPNGHRISRTIV